MANVKNKEKKETRCFACKRCRQQGIYCLNACSPCFGNPCGIVPGTGHEAEDYEDED